MLLNISRKFKAPIENVRKLLETVGEIETINILKSVTFETKKTIKEDMKKNKPIKKRKEENTEPKPAVYEMFRKMKRGNR